jgi:diguanylate cyclase (GGDEF)-like protein/excisionase family DNA binding protein
VRIGKANGGEWLRLTEAARLLGISTTTLRRWSDTGQLACYRSAGGHRRYRRADVEAALATQGERLPGARTTSGLALAPSAGAAPERCLHAARALSGAFATLTRVAVDGVGCGAATIALVDGDDLEVVADHARPGVACRLRHGQRSALDDAPASALAIRERRRVVIADLAGTTVLSTRQTGLYRGLGHTALLVAPVVVQGRTVGALELVDTDAPRAFTSADVAFAEFVARQASLLVAEECGTAPPGPALHVTPRASGGAGSPSDAPPSLPVGSPASRPAPAGPFPPGSTAAGRLDAAGPPETAPPDLVAELRRRNEVLGGIVAAGLHEVAGLRPDQVLRSLLRRVAELTRTPVVDVYAVEGPVMRALASFDGGRFDADWEGVVLPLARYPCSRRAVDTREATIVAGLEDAGLGDEGRYSLEKWGYQAQLSLPLVAEGRVIGLVELSDYAARDFTPEVEVVRGLGAAATQALQNLTLLEQVERRNRILRELVGIGSRASAEHDPSRALGHVAERVLATMSAASCDIYGLDEAGFRCLVSHDRSGPDEAPRGTLLDVESYPTLAAEITAHRTFVLTSPDDPRLGAEERRLYREHGFVSEVAVPLVADGRLYGLLDVYDTRERDYGEYLGFLQTIAGGLAGKMEVQTTVQGLEHRGRTLGALVELTAAAAQVATARELAVIVATRLREAAAMARCDVYSLEGSLLRCLASVDERGLDDEGPDFEFAIDDFPTTAMCVRTGEPLAIERLDADPRLTPEERAHYAEGGFRSELCLPLILDGRVLGLIDLFDRRSRDLGPMTELAGPVARFVAGLHDTLVRLERAGAATPTTGDSTESETCEDTPDAHDREMDLLDEIAAAAGAGRELREIAAAGLARLRTLLSFERAAVAVLEDDGRFAWVHAVGEDGAPGGLIEGPDVLEIPPDRLRRERVVVLGPHSDPAAVPKREQAAAARIALAALLAGGELIGALRVESAATSAFTAADRRLLSRVAAQLALAITSAELNTRVRQVHHSNLRALSGALNAKDYYTLGHAARVAAYMVLLGRELGWGREALRYVEEAAYLHDIGKIAVSDRVLLKAGGLNHREWDLMRQHPIFSAQIIQPLFDHELVAGVRHHHERWDGQGYPDGLAGDAIPLLARAMCVVDSYDAMSLRRPYRQARAYEECLSELRQCAGTHFDPELVGAFLRVLERLRATKRAASEVARRAAARVDPAAHAQLGTLEDETTPSYRAIVGALREVRDAHPPTRFVTTLARRGRRAVVVVDAEDEGSPQRSRIGDEVPFDDDLDAVFSGRAVDSNTLYVDQFGVWVSAVEAIRDRGGATVAVAAADLPIEGDGEMETLRSEVSEAFAAMLELGTGQSMRSELEAVVDSLTGLYTHRYFHERLSEELERCRTQRTSLAVLLLDLDDFRAFNERHGHSAGDGALRAVAHVVESSVRRIDVAARYGGEEFAALLIDTDEPGAVEVAERIRDGIAAVSLAGGENLSVSIGVATYPGDASFKDELLDKADWAMHLAKRQGRDAAVAFSTEHGPGQAGPAAGVDPLCVAALSDLVAAGDVHRRRRRAAVAQIALAVARELGLDPADVRACMSSGVDDASTSRDSGPSGAGQRTTARTLVAVTAGFAAMVAAPPYRPGASEAEALERLLRCPALHGDSRLAEAFAEVVGRRRAP